MDAQPILIGALVVGAFLIIAALVYIGLREDRGNDPLQDRLSAYSAGDKSVQSLEDIELSMSFRDRVFMPLVKRLAQLTARFTPEQQLEEARRLIDMAGMSMDPGAFFMFRIIVLFAFGLLAFMVFFVLSSSTPRSQAILYTLLGLVLGYFFPTLWIKSKISRRQQNIIKALPDALDLLVICVEAGLGFEAAMGKVYEKWDNELSVAFGRVLREIQLGKARRDSLRDMSARMDVPDVTAFTAAIIQADQLGVSMGKILRVQSDQMRVKRRQRAQEKAHQAPVKMMIPMVFLIFPSLWIVLLGPALITLLTNSTVGDVF